MKDEFPTVKLRVRGARGHATFYRKMVDRPEAPVQAGRLVRAVDREGVFVGFGFYHPRSQIALRVLTHEAQPPDAKFFERRLEQAVALRHDLLKLPQTTEAYRVCHSEGDGLSGLIIDRFGDTLVVQLHSLGMYHRLEWIRPALQKLFPETRIVLEADEGLQKIEGFTLPAQPPTTVTVQEHGARFQVKAGRGQKTGFFCDQRDNRVELARLSKGRSVLDLCCYSGGFSIHAALGGAKRMVGVDLDEEALAMARSNAKLNKVPVEFFHADLFNYLRQARETFEVVVLDPPKMVRDPEELEKGLRSYRDMNVIAFDKVVDGGLVVSCSCSGLVSEEAFLEVLRSAARAVERRIQILKVAGAGPDHPVSNLHPEGRYLKTVFSVVRKA